MEQDNRPAATALGPTERWAALAVPIVFFVLVAFSARFAAFEADTDEGINLIKAMLVWRGHPLYAEIWNDQPPLLTYGLAALYGVFGNDVGVARGLVLLSSGALLWCAWMILRRMAGLPHAFLGVLLIAGIPHYVPLSAAVMIGLPALAMAMLSLWALVQWHTGGGIRWLVVSGSALALSMSIKAFTGFLALVFVAGLLTASRRARWKPAAIWAAAFVAFAAAVVLALVGPSNLAQLVEPHTAARGSEALEGFAAHSMLQSKRVLAIVALALAGAGAMALTRRWLALYLIGWAGIAALLLWTHRPVWYHQRLLVTIPCAMLAACALGEAWLRLVAPRLRRFAVGPRGLAAASALVLAVWLPLESRIAGSGPADPITERSAWQTVERMQTWKAETRWVLTDRAMFAFRAGMAVPPEVAVLSLKRLVAGGLDERDVIGVVRTRDPEQIVLARYSWPDLAESLVQRYRLVHDADGIRHYVRKDLVD